MTQLKLEVSDAVHGRLQELAEREGVSVTQLLSSAVSEKLSVMEADRFFRERASKGSRERFHEILAKVPKRKPMKGDEVPASLRAKLNKRAKAR